MYRKLFFLLSFMVLSSAVSAQRWAYVDTEYILQKLPKYREAQSELDRIARNWQQEIDAEIRDLEKMKISLENERVLLTDDLIEERENAIAEKTSEIEKLQIKRFGAEGDLISQRKQLVKPIQDQVFNAVQEIAKKRRYDAVFDKSSDLIMLYYNQKYDISDKVLAKIKDM